MKVSRFSLYEQVWQKPMTSLSKEYGLSDVGLAKICKKYDIPIPERGHWAKIHAGQKILKKPLPHKDQNPDIEIQVKPLITEAEVEAKHLEKERQAEKAKQIGLIHVPEQLESPHRLTKKTQHFFEDIAQKLDRKAKVKDSSKIDWNERPPTADNGRYQCWPDTGYPVKISLNSLHRTLRILDTLVKKLEQLGFTIEDDSAQKQYGREQKMEAVKNGERISFKLSEGYKQTYLSSEELALAKKEYSWASQVVRTPSGILTLTLNGNERWNQKRFADGIQRLEEQLPVIVAEFINGIEEEKRAREQKIQDEIARREKERIRFNEQKKKEAKQTQFNNATTESEKIIELEHLESYLSKLEQSYIAKHGSMDANVNAWFNLVRSIANQKNPLINRLEYLENISKLDPDKLDWMD